jgi:hypothetical protein
MKTITGPVSAVALVGVTERDHAGATGVENEEI